MALSFIKMVMTSATGIKKVSLAPIDGQSARIMALLFIKMDMLSATGIKKVFLALMDGQSAELWRCNSSK